MIQIAVDTNVARAASGRPNAGPPSPECSRVMEHLRAGPFRVVMSQALRDEWRQHATPFAMKWLAELRSRKRVDNIPRPNWPPAAELLAAAADQLGPSGLREVRKDMPVWELAMVSGRRVVSNDDRQRKLLRQIAATVPELQLLAWVPTADATAWLKEGAPLGPPHLVGS